MQLVLTKNQLCVFLSVAQIHDDQPELFSAVTEKDLDVSEMEILRQPPLSSFLRCLPRQKKIHSKQC